MNCCYGPFVQNHSKKHAPFVTCNDCCAITKDGYNGGRSETVGSKTEKGNYAPVFLEAETLVKSFCSYRKSN